MSKARVSEYVIGFALLQASSNGHATSLAIVYRQVASRPHKFRGMQPKQRLNSLQSFCTTPFSSVGKFSGAGNFVSSSAGEILAGFPRNIDWGNFHPITDSNKVVISNLPATSPDKQLPRRLCGVSPQVAERNFLRDLGLGSHCWVVISNERGQNVRKPICGKGVSLLGESAKTGEPSLQVSQPCYHKTKLRPIDPFLQSRIEIVTTRR